MCFLNIIQYSTQFPNVTGLLQLIFLIREITILENIVSATFNELYGITITDWIFQIGLDFDVYYSVT